MLNSHPVTSISRDRRDSAQSDFLSAFWIGMAIALLAGFAEAAIAWQMKSRWGIMGVSPGVLWAAPLVYAAACGIIGTLGWAAMRLAPRVGGRAGIFITLGLCTASVLGLKFPGLHPVALALLAFGIGAQGSAFLFSRRRRITGPARRIAIALLGLSLTILVASTFRTRRDERRAMANLGPASTGAPNVLLIILDTVGAEHLGLYGYPRPTSPVLDTWARRGVVFDHAISTASWTLPAHGTLFTGRYPHEFEYGWVRELKTTAPTLAEAFASAGYVTSAFVGNWIYLGREYGLSRGFAHYDASRRGLGSFAQHAWLARLVISSETVRSVVGTDQLASRITSSDINDRLLSWMDRHSARKPFFTFVNYFDAHHPHIPRHGTFRRLAGYDRSDDLDPLSRYDFRTRRTASRQEVKQSRDSYDALIADQDEALGRLLEGLDSRGMLDNTFIVITSDHGEEFGEHGTFYHGRSLYMSPLRVPLIIIGPGIPPGRRVRETVTLRDIPGTITGLAGLPSGKAFPGISLASQLTGSPSSFRGSPAISETKRSINVPGFYPTARNDAHSLVEGDYHYIAVANEKEELYHWRSDPGELSDLTRRPGGDSIARRMRASLDAALSHK